MEDRTLPDPDDRYVALAWVADRWSVSRTTAARVLEKHGATQFFPSGARRGVRRFRLQDVLSIEAAGRAGSQARSAAGPRRGERR